MGSFYLFFGLALLSLWLIHRARPAGGRFSWLAPFIVLVIFWGGSVENGSDWIWYRQSFFGMAEFDALDSVIKNSVYEPGFVSLMYAVYKTGFPYQALVFLIAIICAMCWGKFIESIGFLSPALVVAFLLLIDGWTLYNEQLRQAIAVSVGLLLFPWAEQRKWIRVGFGFAIAMAFHFSSIVLVPMLVVQRMLNRHADLWRSWWLLFGYAFVLSAAMVVTVMLTRAGFFGQIGLQLVQTKLDLYLVSESYGAPLISAGLVSYAIGIVVVAFSRERVAEQQSPMLKLIWHFSAMWCLLGPILRTVGIFVRFEHFFLVFLVPLCAFLWMRAERSDAFSALMSQGILAVFSVIFTLRIALHPEQAIWVANYQNYFMGALVGIDFDTRQRQDQICENLQKNGNVFCSYAELKY